ncbi:MAG TPA: type II secretion system F family protein [Bryobacteraceae bacterium]|jgi:tight adherence protein B|nr:type II secretion system F family protein [Bryobacteraceae bacterium]
MDLLVSFLIFTGALLIAGYYVWTAPQQEASDSLTVRLRELRTQTRSGSRAPSDLIHREQRGTFAFLGDFFSWLGVMRRLQTYIVQANLKYRAADVVGLSLALAIGFFLLFGLFGMQLFLLRLLLSALAGAIPIGYIRIKRGQRLAKFEDQLPDAIDLFTRTMRSGHNIHSGLETISTETGDPVRMEFRKLMEQLALGSPLENALHDLGERVPVIDLKFFITGLVLQRQTGANMVGVLENLSLLVRERLNMAAKMKAHTAQQRFSAGLLCGLPFVVGIGFWFLKPEYIHLLYSDPIGSKFLTYAIISEIIGILVIRKLANVKF